MKIVFYFTLYDSCDCMKIYIYRLKWLGILNSFRIQLNKIICVRTYV